VQNPEHQHRGVRSATIDGVRVDAQAIPLFNDAAVHEVVIVLGAAEPLHATAAAAGEHGRPV
jgi:hypothetical protein